MSEPVEAYVKSVLPGPDLRGVLVTVIMQDTKSSVTFWEPQGTAKEWRERIGTMMFMAKGDERINTEERRKARQRMFAEGRFDDLADDAIQSR